MDKQQVVEAMEFSGVPEDIACCERILDFLLQKNKRLYYYSDFLDLVEDMGLVDPTQNVQRCLNMLKSKRVGVLRQEYRYLDDEGVIHPVEVDELQAAHEDGCLYLQSFNYADYDYLSKVYIVFVRLEVGL